MTARKPGKKTRSKTRPGPTRDERGRLHGGNPGNRGGQPGKSGRRPDAFREQLAVIRDDAGLRVLEQVLNGELIYQLRGKCEYCGKVSTGKRETSLVPTPDTQLRAMEMLCKHTLPRETIVRLEGMPRITEAFELIKARIHAKLPRDVATDLVADLNHTLADL